MLIKIEYSRLVDRLNQCKTVIDKGNECIGCVVFHFDGYRIDVILKPPKRVKGQVVEYGILRPVVLNLTPKIPASLRNEEEAFKLIGELVKSGGIIKKIEVNEIEDMKLSELLAMRKQNKAMYNVIMDMAEALDNHCLWSGVGDIEDMRKAFDQNNDGMD